VNDIAVGFLVALGVILGGGITWHRGYRRHTRAVKLVGFAGMAAGALAALMLGALGIFLGVSAPIVNSFSHQGQCQPATRPTPAAQVDDGLYPAHLLYPTATTVKSAYVPGHCAAGGWGGNQRVGDTVTYDMSTQDSPSAVIQWYSAQLTSSGWSLEPGGSNGPTLASTVARHAGDTYFVVARSISPTPGGATAIQAILTRRAP
jgi:hypothetical protein